MTSPVGSPPPASSAPVDASPTGHGSPGEGASPPGVPAAVVTSAADRRHIALLLLPLVVMSGLGALGTALSPTLLGQAPLVLVALNPTWRHLLLVAPVVGAAPLFAVALPRLFAVDPFMYALGRDHGDQAISALTEHLGEGAGRLVRRVDGVMRRASWLAVLVWPAPLVCAMAGAARLPVPAFVALNLVGRFCFLMLMHRFGVGLSGPLGALRAFVDRNAGPATVLTAALVLAVTLRTLARRRPASSEG